jgi:hypothetical protein
MEKTPEGEKMTEDKQTDYGTTHKPFRDVMTATLFVVVGIFAFISTPHLEGAPWEYIAVLQALAGVMVVGAINLVIATYAKAVRDDIISELREIHKKEET